MKQQILILGGSGEAFALDSALDGHPDFHAITSLAGRTSLPRKPKGEYRTGGFGGSDGLAHYIQEHHIDAVIDATHPFARNITANATTAAEITDCPLLHIWRAPWHKTDNDNWIEVPTMEAAAAALTIDHSPIFLTIGRLELSAFTPRTDLIFIARAIEPVKANDPQKRPNRYPVGYNDKQNPENFSYIYAKGPFNYDAEYDLIKSHGIKSIVTKNSGGEQARAKLDVARKLNLPVIMIERPETPNGQTVPTATEALDWLIQTLRADQKTS